MNPGNITEISEEASCNNPLFSRTGAMIVTVVGMVLFGGLLISVICNFLERQEERYRNGYNTFILMQTMCPAEDVRRMIYANLSREIEKKIIVKHGQLDIIEDVDSLSLQNAESVYIVGDDNVDNRNGKDRKLRLCMLF